MRVDPRWSDTNARRSHPVIIEEAERIAIEANADPEVSLVHRVEEDARVAEAAL